MTTTHPSRTKAIGRGIPTCSCPAMVHMSGFPTETQHIKRQPQVLLRLSVSLVCSCSRNTNDSDLKLRWNRYGDYCCWHIFLRHPWHTFSQLHARWRILFSELYRDAYDDRVYIRNKAARKLYPVCKSVAHSRRSYFRVADHKLRESGF